MKVQYLTDACVLIEYQGKRLLCDPWLSESICYGGLYHYPPLNIDIEDYTDVDCIYISHIHQDHLDPETLKFFAKDTPIVIHSYAEKFVLKRLHSLGFTNVKEVNHKGKYYIKKDFSIEILAADNCDPKICYKFFGCQVSQSYEYSLQIDSMAVIKGGNYVVVNTNDCPYELSHTMNPYIKENYGDIDLLMTSYNAASPYPQSFDNFSNEEKLIEKEKIRHKCLDRAVNYCRDLQPNFVLPFAAQRVIGGRNVELNKYTATTSIEKVPRDLGEKLKGNNLKTNIVMLNSESYIDLVKGETSEEFTPPNQRFKHHYIYNIIAEKPYLFEIEEWFIGSKERINLKPVIEIAHKRMMAKMRKSYPGLSIEENIYIDVNQEWVYMFKFEDDTVSTIMRDHLVEPYLKLNLDYSLFKMILEKKAHWNNAEFGSFITYLRKPNIFNRSIHHIISYLHI